jgi:hypothetical protein
MFRSLASGRPLIQKSVLPKFDKPIVPEQEDVRVVDFDDLTEDAGQASLPSNAPTESDSKFSSLDPSMQVREVDLTSVAEESPSDETTTDSYDDRVLSTLTVKQLKDLCKQRGVVQTGKKQDLVARLRKDDAPPLGDHHYQQQQQELVEHVDVRSM